MNAADIPTINDLGYPPHSLTFGGGEARVDEHAMTPDGREVCHAMSEQPGGIYEPAPECWAIEHALAEGFRTRVADPLLDSRPLPIADLEREGRYRVVLDDDGENILIGGRIDQ